jgi:striatin 1/3/4
MERHNYDQHPPPLTAIDGRKPFELPSSSDEQVESISHSFDSHGKTIPGKREIESIQTTEIPLPKEESEGWNFDDSPSALEPPPEDTRRDSDTFPGTIPKPPMSPPRLSPGTHRRKSSGARRRSEGGASSQEMTRSGSQSGDPSFKVRFALRGHLDVVRTVIFTGGGSPSEPEICTSGDDGTIKRWIIPASYGSFGPQGASQGNDLDITAYFTHRGHNGSVTSLAACPASPNFSNGGRALGDGWVFSGGEDATIRVWERGRVDPKATLDGHTDAVWALAVLPGSTASIFGDRCGHYGGPDRILLASGGADGNIRIWAVSAPPQLNSPHTGSRRGQGRRANSVSSGSNFPSSPQPSTASGTPFHYALVHHIIRADHPSPTCISPLSSTGDTFVVSYTDASILVYDTRTGEEMVGMASLETYDGTPSTGVNSVVASIVGFDATHHLDPGRGLTEEDAVVHGATGSSGGVEGVIISGYEDRYIRFFDANSGMYPQPIPLTKG